MLQPWKFCQSREKYFRIYQNFKDWQLKYGVSKISSVLIMAYFHTLEEKKYKPTTLWALYSMLKATLRVKEDIDIGKYTQVIAFLKTKSSGFKSIKAEVFTEVGIKTFIDEAEGLHWLDVKVSTNSKKIKLLFLQIFIQFDFRWLVSSGYVVRVVPTNLFDLPRTTLKSTAVCIW